MNCFLPFYNSQLELLNEPGTIRITLTIRSYPAIVDSIPNKLCCNVHRNISYFNVILQ